MHCTVNEKSWHHSGLDGDVNEWLYIEIMKTKVKMLIKTQRQPDTLAKPYPRGVCLRARGVMSVYYGHNEWLRN